MTSFAEERRKLPAFKEEKFVNCQSSHLLVGRPVSIKFSKDFFLNLISVSFSSLFKSRKESKFDSYRWVQLATIGIDNTPRVRTVVFRG